MSAGDPRPLLTQLGVRFETVTAAGYSGTLDAQAVFLHWTAGSVSDDQARYTVADLSYHMCAGPTCLFVASGFGARMGHGGSGRNAPLDIARRGQMTLPTIKQWQPSTAPDDTDSGPNHFARACSIAHPGDPARPPSDGQLALFCAGAAALLVSQGCGIGSLMDHDSSTARKIDLGWLIDRAYNDTARYVAILTGENVMDPVQTIVDFALAPDGGGAVLFGDGRIITRSHAHFGDPVTATTHDLQQPPAVGFDWTPTGKGYTIVDSGGYSFDYGDAKSQGRYAR